MSFSPTGISCITTSLFSQNSFLIFSSNSTWNAYALIIFSIFSPKQVSFLLIYHIISYYLQRSLSIFCQLLFSISFLSFLMNHLHPVFSISRLSPTHFVSCKNIIMILLLIIVSTNSIPFTESVPMFQLPFQVYYLN